MVALPSLRVVPARVEDAEALIDLRQSVLVEGCWFATRPDEHPVSIEHSQAVVSGLLAQPNGTMLVAWLEGELVGLIAVHGERLARMRHVGRMEMMVDKSVRGQGVGTALLVACLRWAAAAPLLRKLSLAVFADNQVAIDLYRRHGFVHEGRREGEYMLEDGTARADLLMARDVGVRNRS